MRKKKGKSPEEEKILEERRAYMRNYYRQKRLQLLRSGRFIRRKAAKTQPSFKIVKLNEPIIVKFN